MIGASFAFALMAAAVKLAAQQEVPLGQTLFYRGVISAMIVVAYMQVAHVGYTTPHWKAHVQRAVPGVIGMIGFFGSVVLLPLATAVTLNYTSPLLMATVLLVLHRERPPARMVAALLG